MEKEGIGDILYSPQGSWKGGGRRPEELGIKHAIFDETDELESRDFHQGLKSPH